MLHSRDATISRIMDVQDLSHGCIMIVLSSPWYIHDLAADLATSLSSATRDFVGRSLLLHLCPSSLRKLQPIVARNRHYKSPKGGTSKINHRPRQAELQHQPGIPPSSPTVGCCTRTHGVLHYLDCFLPKSPHNSSHLCFDMPLTDTGAALKAAGFNSLKVILS